MIITFTPELLIKLDVCRIDTGDDNRVSREEFTSDTIKETIERVGIVDNDAAEAVIVFQWVGPVEDMSEEFDKIDKNGGGQILFSEFVDWALEKNLDIEDDIDED